MKKLFWSAFAMSLIVLSTQAYSQNESVDEFLGLDAEILPEFEGEHKFTTPELHDTRAWKVTPDKVEIDQPEPNKGQNYSIIPWTTQDPEDWLSIHTWLDERKIKDKTDDWKIRLRQDSHKELMGKILQCRGECLVYRGSLPTKAQHLSRLLEGDEIKTGKDSVAWVYMMDGSLLRLSADTSVSVNEFNIGKSEIFILARLNQGHIFWHPRSKKDFPVDYAPETDSLSLPLMVRESNQQFFERALFHAQTDQEQLTQILTMDDNAIDNQVKVLNDFRKFHNSLLTLGTKVMIVSPNSTIISKQVSFDFVYLPAGNGYFKKRSTEVDEEFSLHLRGYLEAGVHAISNESWHEVDMTGRNYQALTDVPGPLQVLELLTKRIKTIDLAREIWIKEFTLPLLKVIKEPRVVARDFGYSIWGDEMEKRFNFLVEYTRRIETTNLRSIENLITKLEATSKTIKRELSDEPYRESLKHYLLGLKSRYHKKKTRVKEMNDLQYYVWILKNGKS